MTNKIKSLEKNTKTIYVEVARGIADNLTFSASGKAVLLRRPRHIGEFWCPLSLLRLGNDWQVKSLGSPILVPAWFLQSNRIEF